MCFLQIYSYKTNFNTGYLTRGIIKPGLYWLEPKAHPPLEETPNAYMNLQIPGTCLPEGKQVPG
jgi:hypothetical protein